MITIIFFNSNKIVVEVSKTTKVEKKVYSKKDRYTFIKPNNKPYSKHNRKRSALLKQIRK